MNFKDISVEQFIHEYAIRSVAYCFSGGKDSLVATHFMMSLQEDHPFQWVDELLCSSMYLRMVSADTCPAVPT
jgi:3'-phosphoadenosine 5'-phosphosulfate sulfotransferase (PAPS reductase)/FAD synthetase